MPVQFSPLVVFIDLNGALVFTIGMVMGAALLALVRPRRKR